MASSNRVGVRELRQNLSKHLVRVKAGEVLTVTERGEDVARLVPTRSSVSPQQRELEAKLAQHMDIIPATMSGTEALERFAARRAVGPPMPALRAGELDEILADMKRDKL